MSARPRTARARRGFTLVEVMIAAAIVAMLASIALPTFRKMALRARAAERRPIMASIVRAIESTAQATEALPGCVPRQDCVYWAEPNPPALPPGGRVPLDWSRTGWRELSMIVEGASSYQYWVLGTEVMSPRSTTLVVGSTGDLDADGVPAPLVLTYRGVANSLKLVAEAPPPGPSDVF
jgi:prepilin-type N-terminal cleavage/methylation domain-containing protein